MKSFEHRGTTYNVLNADDLNDLGFDIPVWDNNYSDYFNENDNMIISTGFLCVLKNKQYEVGEWHHIFMSANEDKKNVSKVFMDNFFEKYFIN